MLTHVTMEYMCINVASYNDNSICVKRVYVNEGYVYVHTL